MRFGPVRPARELPADIWTRAAVDARRERAAEILALFGLGRTPRAFVG